MKMDLIYRNKIAEGGGGLDRHAVLVLKIRNETRTVTLKTRQRLTGWQAAANRKENLLIKKNPQLLGIQPSATHIWPLQEKRFPDCWFVVYGFCKSPHHCSSPITELEKHLLQ